MVVVLADGRYRVLRLPHPQPRDGHGLPVPGGGTWTEFVDGAAGQQPDGSWSLRLDPSVWPVHAGDTVEREDGSRWVVYGEPRLSAVPDHPDVDHVRVTARQDPPDPDRGQPGGPL
jgi:hypothetical protein